MPRFPAMFVLLAVLAAWVVLCAAPRRDSLTPWFHIHEVGHDGLFPKDARGFPFVFVETIDERGTGTGFDFARRHHAGLFLADLALALAAAWAPAMTLDRLLFPWLRRRRRTEQAPGEPI